MAALLGPTNESGIVYTLLAANGASVDFNNNGAGNNIGPLSGDEGVTGFDSAEIIESYAQKTEDDGALHGNFYLGRRPITFSGTIVPTSALDRAQRINKLKLVLNNMLRNDGYLYFTPTGGELSFIRVRAQQPPRIRGKWAKEFFISLVADDPRVYGLTAKLGLYEHAGTVSGAYWRRFTYASTGATDFADRDVYLAPGTYDIKHWVRRSTNTGTASINVTPNSSIGVSSISTSTAWQEMTVRVTTTAGIGSPTTLTFFTGATLTAGQWIEVGPTMIERVDGSAFPLTSTFATNFAGHTGRTASFSWSGSETAPPGWENQGTATAYPIIRESGPFTSGGFAVGAGYISYSGVSYSSSDYIVVDKFAKTALKNNSANEYSKLTGSNDWRGIPPGNTMPAISSDPSYGTSTATRYEARFRNTYL